MASLSSETEVVRGAWTFIGRDEELRLIASLVHSDDRRGALLQGPAGVGKSRLVREAMSDAGQGLQVTWVTATQAARAIPLGAFSHLLVAAGPVPPELDSFSLLQWATHWLTRPGSAARTVVAVDDAHFLDDMSATLLHGMVLNHQANVVLTIRDGTSAPDAIGALVKEGLLEQVEVRPLAQLELNRLLASVLPGRVGSGTRRILWQLSAGNPLFVRELVIRGLDCGALTLTDGFWTWSGEVRLGARLAEVVQTRLASVGDDERAALEIVAVGEPLALEVMTALQQRTAVSALERKGIVLVDASGRIGFSHPLYGEVVRQGIPSLARKEILTVLADMIDRPEVADDPDLLRVAVWRLDSGVVPRRGLMSAASSRAMALFDYVLAERLARAAVVEDDTFEHQLLLGEILAYQGRSDEALALLEPLHRDASNGDESARSALVIAQLYLWGGKAEWSADLLLEAQGLARDPMLRDECVLMRGTVALLTGRPADAFEACLPLVDGTITSERAVLRGLTVLIPVLAMMGRFREAMEAGERGLALLETYSEVVPLAPGQILAGQVVAQILSGRLGDAEALCITFRRRMGDFEDHAVLGIVMMMQGQARLRGGRVSTAVDELSEAAAHLRRRDPVGFLPWCLANLAEAMALSGDLSGAAVVVDEASTRTHPAFQPFDSETARARVWILACRGEISAARRLALASAEEAQRLGQMVPEAFFLHDLIRLGDHASADRLGRLVEGAGSEGILLPTLVTHGQCLRAADGLGLEQVARRLQEAGCLLLAAEATAQAVNAHVAAGATIRASVVGERLTELVAQCEGARTPTLTVNFPELPLTPREREIAELAVQSHSNLAIGETLGMSVRTVESHLHHVYTKLGIGSRKELRVILQPS